MNGVEAHWAAVVAALQAEAGSDLACPSPRPPDLSVPALSKFLRFEPRLSADAIGDPETRFDYAACVDYESGALWVECAFRPDHGESHAFDVLRVVYDNGGVELDDPLHWNPEPSRQRATLRLVESGAAALPPEIAAQIAVDGLKRLEAALGLLILHRGY